MTSLHDTASARAPAQAAMKHGCFELFKTVSVGLNCVNNLRAVLVQQRKRNTDDLLEEFEALAGTASYNVVGKFDLTGKVSARYGIGSGKAEEIGTYIEVNDAEIALMTPGVGSSQMYRLMQQWGVEVRNRAQVILEIFDIHAKTAQAKLQIEEARLRYELPFIRHQLQKHLQKEHTGARPVGEQVGAGEDLLNLRMMEVRKRIASIRDRVKQISDSDDLKRRKRLDEDFLEVALAGYTNAGKSTLHNALTSSGVEIADRMFTTLSTKVSRLEIPGRRIVITDSVGFISDLPTPLLQAFNTTLMEIGVADLILLVVDGSDPLSEMMRKVRACFETFERIGIQNPNMIAVLNKVDLIDASAVSDKIDSLKEFSGKVVPISAKSGTNMDQLLSEVMSSLPIWLKYLVTIPYGSDSMSLLSWIHEVTKVESEVYNENTITVEALLSPAIAQKLLKTLPEGSVRCLE